MEGKDEKMAVYRIHKKKKDFTIMSNHHFRNREMSLKAKGLLSLMLSLPDDWEYSAEGLQELSSDGRESLAAAVKELKKFGYLSITREQIEGGKFSYVYDVFEVPGMDSKPFTALPSTDSHTTDDRITVNRQRQTSNNKILNTNDELSSTNNQVLSGSRCISLHSRNNLQPGNSGSNSYESITPCYTPTEQDIQKIITTWNSQKCTKDIQRITPMDRRWNNTLLCIRNDYEAFLAAIRDIDNQAYFVKRYADRNQPVTYDSFIEPDNYLKYIEGNYRDTFGREGGSDGLTANW